MVNRLAILKLDGEYLSVFHEIAEQGSVNRNSIVIQRLLGYLDPIREAKKFILSVHLDYLSFEEEIQEVMIPNQETEEEFRSAIKIE